jgi:hypothetical protein
MQIQCSLAAATSFERKSILCAYSEWKVACNSVKTLSKSMVWQCEHSRLMKFVNFNVIEINRSMRVPILALCTLLGSVLSTVKVYSPNYLAAKYSDITFDYRISSFGKVPYGHTIVGNLRIAVPENGCGKNVKVDYDPKQRDPLILLVMRGGCPFLEKVQNGQALKAAMVIIIDDHDEEMRVCRPLGRERTFSQCENSFNRY